VTQTLVAEQGRTRKFTRYERVCLIFYPCVGESKFVLVGGGKLVCCKVVLTHNTSAFYFKKLFVDKSKHPIYMSIHERCGKEIVRIGSYWWWQIGLLQGGAYTQYECVLL